jgi:hypothetical protein
VCKGLEWKESSHWDTWDRSNTRKERRSSLQIAVARGDEYDLSSVSCVTIEEVLTCPRRKSWATGSQDRIEFSIARATSPNLGSQG